MLICLAGGFDILSKWSRYYWIWQRRDGLRCDIDDGDAEDWIGLERV